MTEHALIMCREPGRHSTLDKGHEEGGSAYANAGSSLRSPPGYSRASPPQKNQSLPTVLLCAITSDFTGGSPPPPSRSLCQRVHLQLQFLKIHVILPVPEGDDFVASQTSGQLSCGVGFGGIFGKDLLPGVIEVNIPGKNTTMDLAIFFPGYLLR